MSDNKLIGIEIYIWQYLLAQALGHEEVLEPEYLRYGEHRGP